jgi:glycosyltransferase involved in cell wall biosynthesis
VHNFFPLVSPAVFYAARREGVPVIQTLHNFRLICAGGLLFRDGKPCELCLERTVHLPGIKHGCYRANSFATAGVAGMLAVHNVLRTWSRLITAYVVFTEFGKNKFIAGGLPGEKIHVKPNFVDDPGVGNGNGGFALYVGRLSPEKGINVLLSAWKRLGHRIQLKVVGTGPLEESARRTYAGTPGIEFLGWRPNPMVQELMGRASVLLFPSMWYEGMPRTLIEAMAKGTPAIASNLGAMSTLINHRGNGLHFPAGDEAALASEVEWMLDHPAEWHKIRQNARREYELHYTPDANYSMLMGIYENAFSQVHKRRSSALAGASLGA